MFPGSYKRNISSTSQIVFDWLHETHNIIQVAHVWPTRSWTLQMLVQCFCSVELELCACNFLNFFAAVYIRLLKGYLSSTPDIFTQFGINWGNRMVLRSKVDWAKNAQPAFFLSKALRQRQKEGCTLCPGERPASLQKWGLSPFKTSVISCSISLPKDIVLRHVVASLY